MDTQSHENFLVSVFKFIFKAIKSILGMLVSIIIGGVIMGFFAQLPREHPCRVTSAGLALGITLYGLILSLRVLFPKIKEPTNAIIFFPAIVVVIWQVSFKILSTIFTGTHYHGVIFTNVLVTVAIVGLVFSIYRALSKRRKEARD